MTRPRPETLAAVLPYAVWMVIMIALPATAVSYAVRALATLAVMVGLLPMAKRVKTGFPTASSALWGLIVGVIVFVLWIARETLFPGSVAVEPSPYDPAVCGWTLTIVKLLGSAFVIAPAEEMFFRGFLYRWLVNDRDWMKADSRKFDLAAFLWVVALFALEHNTRIAEGAMAGAFYGYLAIRKGLVPAIVAHATTNLVLALYVILTESWGFW